MQAWHDIDAERRHAVEGPRTHPWTVTAHDEDQRYVDFKTHPGLIESTCLDFAPWSTWSEVQAFFDLLRWLNGTAGYFESNDCAFLGPAPNDRNGGGPEHVRTKRLRSSGRCMMLYRDLSLNVDHQPSAWLLGAFVHYLQQFEAPNTVVVGLSKAPARFVDLDGQPLGHQLVIEWWTWGDDAAEIRLGLGAVVEAIRWAIDYISKEVDATSANKGQTPP